MWNMYKNNGLVLARTFRTKAYNQKQQFNTQSYAKIIGVRKALVMLIKSFSCGVAFQKIKRFLRDVSLKQSLRQRPIVARLTRPEGKMPVRRVLGQRPIIARAASTQEKI